ncbi:MAG: hypothetical protein GEU80_16850 [Dehalococcoidia bacterium]|nr:hypothetical protein [Dehalococcoidia bacterium]
MADEQKNYWARRHVGRRSFLHGASVGALGLSAAALIGCGDEDDPDTGGTPGGGGATSTGTPATGGTPAGGDDLASRFSAEFWRVDPANARPGETLVIDHSDEALTLDNHREETPGSIHATQPTHDQLFQRWEDWERFGGKVFVEPLLAESFEQVDDTTLVLNLQQGVHFHNLPPVNGREFVAEDVVYNLERMTADDPELRTRTAFGEFASIEATDDYTVQIKMAEPFASLVTNLGHTWNIMVSPELGETDEITQRSIGTGPFIFNEWRRGIEVTYDANPDYWIPGIPFVDGIQLRWVPDSAARTASFRTGETDTWSGGYSSTPKDVIDALHESVGGDAEVRRFESEATGTTKISLDTANPPFEDKRLRDALKYGIDYSRIIAIFGGLAKRTGMMNLENLEWGLKPEELPADIITEGDPAKAAKLLQAAGYGPDNPLKVKNTVSQFYSGPSVAQIVQAMAAPLNIEVEIQVMELGDWITNVYRAGQPYQMNSHADWTWEDPDRGLYGYYHSQGIQNNTHYNSPDVDSMLEAQRGEFDLETRQQIVKDIQLQVINDTPTIWLVAPGGINLVRNRIKNFKRMIHGNSNIMRQYATVWFGDPTTEG